MNIIVITRAIVKVELCDLRLINRKIFLLYTIAVIFVTILRNVETG